MISILGRWAAAEGNIWRVCSVFCSHEFLALVVMLSLQLLVLPTVYLVS